jgi:hypothetical protein
MAAIGSCRIFASRGFSNEATPTVRAMRHKCGGERAYLAKPRAIAPAADRRPLHEDEAGALQMPVEGLRHGLGMNSSAM